MKKALNVLTVAAAILTMMVCLTACGGPTSEQIQKMDALFAKYDATIADCETEITKFPDVKDEEYKKNLDETKKIMVTVKSESEILKNNYNQSKKLYSVEEADEIIVTMEGQIASSEKFLAEIKKGVKDTLDILEKEKQN